MYLVQGKGKERERGREGKWSPRSYRGEKRTLCPTIKGCLIGQEDNGIRSRIGTSGLAAGNECSLAFMHIFRLGTCLNFSFPRDKSVPLISSFCLCFYLLPSVFANPVKERKKTVKAETTFMMVLSFTFPLIFSRPNV